MKWKSWVLFFIVKSDNHFFDNKINSIINSPPSIIDPWYILRHINNDTTPIKPWSKKNDGMDHRPITETDIDSEVDSMYNITKNFFKMKLLKRLESDKISNNEKLNSIIENEWLLTNKSSYLPNLLAGDLINIW